MRIFYTDKHDVDEDLRTACTIGGRWLNYDIAGMMCRFMNDDPTNSVGVASSDISKLIKYYADVFDVDEDRMTITRQGGSWRGTVLTGITYQLVLDSPTDSYNDVASYV